ncbi:hypothetical protein ACWFMI_21895 [Nocardiopsis terrae]
MTNPSPTTRTSRRIAFAAVAAGGLLTLAAAPSAAADTTSPPPECVQYHSSWRYTHVSNGCESTVTVTVEYTDGQEASCRVIEPGGWATFNGYGPRLNYVTGLRVCDSDSTTTSGG